MYRATTPTHIFKLPFSTGQLQEIRITYQQNGETVLQKTEADCTLLENEIKVTLTQEETLLFSPDERVSIQLRTMTSEGVVMASDICKIWARACLDEEVLS